MRIIYRHRSKCNYKLVENNPKRDRKISRSFNFQLQVTVFRLKKQHLVCHIQTERAAMRDFSFPDRFPAKNPNKFRSNFTALGP